jgi:hypothetical protein
MDFVELAFFFSFCICLSLSADTSVIAHQLNSSVHRWGATLMNSFPPLLHQVSIFLWYFAFPICIFKVELGIIISIVGLAED